MNQRDWSTLFVPIGCTVAFFFFVKGWPLLVGLIAGASGLLSALIYLDEFEPTKLAGLEARYPALAKPVHLMRWITGREAKVSPGPKEPHPGALLLATLSEFEAARERLLDAVRGRSLAIEAVVSQVRAQTLARSRVPSEALSRPLGVFLLIGSDGLGKRFFAERFASELSRSKLVYADLADPSGAALTRVTDEVAAEQCRGIILDNVDQGERRTLDLVAAIARGQRLRSPQSGKVADFRSSVLFLLVHKPGDALARKDDPGLTKMADMVGLASGLPPALVSQVDQTLPFVMPDARTCGEIVQRLMEHEASLYSLEIVKMSAERIAREVNAVQRAGTFAQAPGRIRKVLGPFVAAAAARGESVIDLSGQGESAAQDGTREEEVRAQRRTGHRSRENEGS